MKGKHNLEEDYYEQTHRCDARLNETQELMNLWGKGEGEKGTLMDCINHHFENHKHDFEEHGNQVGAISLIKYLRKSKEFLQNHKGATMRCSSGGTPGAKTYEKKSGEFIIISVSGKILSYGKNKK